MDKFFEAVKILRPNTQMIWETPIETEENFNKVKWVTGVNSDNEAITTTTNPHTELSWSAVKTEMDKL